MKKTCGFLYSVGSRDIHLYLKGRTGLTTVSILNLFKTLYCVLNTRPQLQIKELK